jgi:uncharacterized protein (TIGR00369 family)
VTPRSAPQRASLRRTRCSRAARSAEWIPSAPGTGRRTDGAKDGADGVVDDGIDDVAANGFAERLGAVAEAAGDGSAQISFQARDEHLNRAGTLHGGVLATLVDTAMGVAVRSAADDGDVPATSQLTVTYLRPGTPGHLEVTAKVRTRGEHLTVCEADVEQDGRSLVHAVATFALLHS